MTTGYSKTPLVKKLGIKENFRIKLFNRPENYFLLLPGLPDTLTILENESEQPANFIHYFALDKIQFLLDIKNLQDQIRQDGMIWISWDKTKSRQTDAVNENFIRQAALNLKLVDVKVCALDEKWSGLKLVIRKEQRKTE